MITVAKNTVVSLRFIMRNDRGEVLEDNMHLPPVNYLHGGAAILASLQKQLEGMKQGDKKLARLDAARDGSPGNFTFEVIVDDVREALQEEIMLGYPVLINEKICGDDCACHDPEDARS